MTGDTAASTMKQEIATALLPKLRFPEFREAEGWMTKRLGNFLRKVAYLETRVMLQGR
jgi:hypothetical protein